MKKYFLKLCDYAGSSDVAFFTVTFITLALVFIYIVAIYRIDEFI